MPGIFNHLLNTDVNTQVAQASDPAAPPSGNLTYYVKKLAGRETLWMAGPKGKVRSIEFPGATSFLSQWIVGPAAAGTSTGIGTTQAGNTIFTTPATTNKYTMMARTTHATVVTTQNQQVGLRATSNTFFRGNAAGVGGFFFVAKFGFDTIKTSERAFVGLTATPAAAVTADPSSQVNCVGFGFDVADTAWTFMHNDGSGTATKDAIGGQATLATNNTGFIAYIFAYPNDTTVYYRLDDLIQGTTLIDSSASADLPVNTTALGYACVQSNGTANTAAGDATMGIQLVEIYTEL